MIEILFEISSASEVQNGNIQIPNVRSTLFEISRAFESLPLRGGRLLCVFVLFLLWNLGIRMPEVQNGNIQNLNVRSTLLEISRASESLPLRGGRLLCGFLSFLLGNIGVWMPEVQNGNIQNLNARSTLLEISSASESLPLWGGRWRRRRRMRANHAVMPLFKAILVKVILAMFALRTEGFPLGGSCRVSDWWGG